MPQIGRLFWLGALLAIGACTEVLELESEGMEPHLVITGVISTEAGYHMIEVASTAPYFGSEMPVNIDATRVVLDGVELKRVTTGKYETSGFFAAEPGRTYVLEVWIDYDEDGTDEYYTASTTVPQLHELASLRIESAMPSSTPDIPFLLVMGFQDSIGEDCYGASLYINGEWYSNRILRYYVHSTAGYSQDGEFLHIPVTDWILMKSLTWDNGGEKFLYVGDELTVELNALSKEYYTYLLEAKTEKNQQYPLFSGPRGNVNGNISGGALGIFGSYTVSRKSVIIPECPSLPVR